MGTVLDVYWNFSEPGDHYLGRILSGLDPTKPNFTTLPPHFEFVDLMGKSDIKEAALLTYGDVMSAYDGMNNNPASILIQCLACIVHHSDAIISVMNSIPGHDFNKVPLFHNRELLSRLKLFVTTDPTVDVMPFATGIPPHIEVSMQAKVKLFYYLCYLIF